MRRWGSLDRLSKSVSCPGNFTFSTADTGVLTLPVRVRITPDTAAIRDRLRNKVQVEVGAIGTSHSPIGPYITELAWDHALAGDFRIGNAVYDATAQLWTATTTFTRLPLNNPDFGLKTARVRVLNQAGTGTMAEKTASYEVFYPGPATNHPGGTATFPNWFHYYQQNEGGTDYTYDGTISTSQSEVAVPGSIRIAGIAYSDGFYITTSLATGRLMVTGLSADNRYYANFVGVLAHERQHTTNETLAGPPIDTDGDYLSDAFETNTSRTDPNRRDSAVGDSTRYSFDDGEVYAGGPVEEAAVRGANTAQDWASPGTNKA